MGHASPVHLLFILIFFAFLIIAKKNYQVSSIFPLLEADPQIIVKNLLSPLFYLLYSIWLFFIFFRSQPTGSGFPQYFRLFHHRSFVLLASYCIGLAYFGDIFSKNELAIFIISTQPRKAGSWNDSIFFYMMIVLPLFGLYLSFWFSQLIESQRQIFPTFAEQHNGWITAIWALAVVVLSVYPSLNHGIWPIYSMSNIINLIVAGILSISYLILHPQKGSAKFS